jgi:hypothetical protein
MGSIAFSSAQAAQSEEQAAVRIVLAFVVQEHDAAFDCGLDLVTHVLGRSSPSAVARSFVLMKLAGN